MSNNDNNDYNKSMNKGMYSTNNLKVVNGKEKLKRWTVLDVDMKTIDDIKAYAADNGLTISHALSELVRKGSSKRKVVYER